jgi:hypothetical protein
VIWQRDVPLEMASGATRAIADAVVATGATIGQHLLSGRLKTRDGGELALATTSFEIVTGTVAVSVRTDASLYRRGAPVTVSGTLRNLAAAPEPTGYLQVNVHGRFCDVTVHGEDLALAASESRDYSVSFVPADVCPFEPELAVQASLFTPSATARSEAPFRTGQPAIDVRFDIPDPSLRLVPSSPSLVAAEETDLDAVTHDDAPLDGVLPFPVVLEGVRHTSFRQSPHGFVELVPEGAPGPTGYGGGCLESSWPATLLAGFLSELDAGAPGFVGWKRYPRGALDRAGRLFEKETVVFFWDAPARYLGDRHRFQLLLSEDGLVRADVGQVSPALAEPASGCSRTGLAQPSGAVLPFEGAAPSGVRLEAVGRGAFSGRIAVANTGSFPGTVSLDYGREGGPRSVETLTVAPREIRVLGFTDAVTSATRYTLVATGDASVSLEEEVTPAEGLLVRYTAATELEPGPATLPVRFTKAGGVAGPVEVTFALAGPSGTQTLVRSYDPEPGLPIEDGVAFALAEGVSTLTVAADVPLEAEPAVLRVGPRERVTVALGAATAEAGGLRFTADVTNTGLSAFAGELAVEGVGGGATPVAVAAGDTARMDLAVDLAGATPGPNTYTVRLVSSAGVLLYETTISHDVVGARVSLVGSPAGTALEPGAPASLAFRLRNVGDQRALGTFSFELFDEEQSFGFDVAPGAEQEIAVPIEVEADVEEKLYPARYRIAARGQAEIAGQVNVTVNGIALEVEPSLDKAAYLDGETARLTVAVTNSRPTLGTDYLIRVHYGGFEEVRPLAVSGVATVVLEIPLPQVTGEPAFVGISHPDGRSLYINTLHVRRAEALASVTLDQNVYAPGAVVAITASAASAGTLTLEAPGYTESLALTGTVTRSFTLPADLPGGTQFVSWGFTGAAGSASGSVPFDVAGLLVRVFEARLDKGRYETGETVETTLQVHTSHAASVLLRAFVLDPEGLSQLVGETTLDLQPDADLLATHGWPFASDIAGLHRLVYGIYQPGSDTLLASGSLAFDVGNATVLGVRTDRSDYPEPATVVAATVSAFVSGPATLRLEVDGEAVRTLDVTALGIVELPLTLDGVAAGPHGLVAVMDGGGYTSRASTSFSMGTSLPDLVAGLPFARPVSGAAWKIDVAVQNSGRTQAGATDVLARDAETGAPLGAASVPALAAGAMAVASIDWNVLGAGGSREVEVVADAGASVVEFREDNNAARATLEVPVLVMEAVAAASYRANVEADLHASVTNLTADTTYTGLSVFGSVVTPGGESVTLPPGAIGSLGPGATAAVGTPWAVGRSTPGAYVFEGRLFDDAGSAVASSARAFEVLPTLAFTGSVSSSPSPAVPGEPLQLAGRIAGAGNVSASGSAEFQIVAPDRTVAARASVLAEVPLDGATDVSATLDPLAVQPGSYDLVLEMEVETRAHPVASAPLVVAGDGLEAGIGMDAALRVLVYVGGLPHDAAGVARRTAFVQASLGGFGVVLRTTTDPADFALQLRSGLWNTYVVMTDAPPPLALLGDELREAAHRGDGLVFVPWQAAAGAHEVEPALGAKVAGNIPGNAHTLQILDGPLGPAETLTLRSSAVRLKLNGASLAGAIGSTPVLATSAFGRGRTVTIAFDPALEPQDAARAALEALLRRAVLHAAPRAPRLAAAGNVIPLVLTLDNPGGAARTVEVSLSLPAGVRVALLEDAPVSSDPPSWQVEVPPGVQRILHFQVVLPDQAGSYPIDSRIKLDGQALAGPPSLILDVPRSTEDSLAAVIAQLDALDVPPGDRGHVQSAITHLRQAQACTPPGLPGLEARIRLAAEAASSLGRVAGIDVAAARVEIDLMIAAWARAAQDLAVPTGGA